MLRVIDSSPQRGFCEYINFPDIACKVLYIYTFFWESLKEFLSHPRTSGCGTVIGNKVWQTLLVFCTRPTLLFFCRNRHPDYVEAVFPPAENTTLLLGDNVTQVWPMRHKQMCLGVSGKLLFLWQHTPLFFLLPEWTTGMRPRCATTILTILRWWGRQKPSS